MAARHRMGIASLAAIPLFLAAPLSAQVADAPPDTIACIFWLKNRRRQEWRDKFDHAVRGKLALDGKASVADLTEAELLAIAAGVDARTAGEGEVQADA